MVYFLRLFQLLIVFLGSVHAILKTVYLTARVDNIGRAPALSGSAKRTAKANRIRNYAV